jgi:hypothetical protein
MRVYSGPLHVHYGPAYVMSGEDGDTSDMEACFRGQSNGLLGAARRGWMFMLTGLHTGVVQLTVEVTDAQPLLGDEWEECVEASFAPHGPDVRLIGWDREPVCEVPLPAGDYRVRYTARRMDAVRTADTIVEGEDPIDSYQLSFWPSAPAPDRVIRWTSETARYWHDWAKGL